MAYIPHNDDEDKDKSVYKQLFNASTVGMALVSGILVGGVMGYFLDKWLGTSPWLLFVFLIFGFIAGVKNALHYLKKAGISLEDIREDKKEKK
ncbi:MAG: AtpZ/AtpI family protein [Candidatus Mucispirillum faecigallinarum]|nr:AtpZ/AtpI family protein [Candidatus Mucispirillum faecigallinarum]